MDIRIVTKLCLASLFSLLLVLNSCKLTNIQQAKRKENEFLVKEFKTLTFISCLKHGFNESEAIKTVLTEDKSFSQDYALGGHYGFIDTLGMRLKFKIQRDSILVNRPFYKNLEEYKAMIGKRVFYICLNYYSSNELDSIANRLLIK